MDSATGKGENILSVLMVQCNDCVAESIFMLYERDGLCM